jgi:hypothetical protein
VIVCNGLIAGRGLPNPHALDSNPVVAWHANSTLWDTVCPALCPTGQFRWKLALPRRHSASLYDAPLITAHVDPHDLVEYNLGN